MTKRTASMLFWVMFGSSLVDIGNIWYNLVIRLDGFQFRVKALLVFLVLKVVLMFVYRHMAKQ